MSGDRAQQLDPAGTVAANGSLSAGGYWGNGPLWTVLWPRGLVGQPYFVT
jgi:hypothetical protein